MFDLPGEYQAIFFANYSKITPSVETIPVFLEMFKHKNFLPNTYQEIQITRPPSLPRPQPRLRLSPPNGEWSVEIGLSRITFKKQPIPPKGSNMGSVEDFVQEVIDFGRRIQQSFPIEANRLALVIQGLLREMTEERLQQVYEKLFRPIAFYAENPPIEWELASAARIPLANNGGGERIHVNTRIQRVRGLLVVPPPSGLAQFDRIQITFDINTFQDKGNRAFGAQMISEFFTKAAELQSRLLTQLEENVNA